MVPIRAASHPVRFAWAAAFALLLAVRLLAPAGFMPAFDHGSVTIIACVGSDPPMMMIQHHHKPAGHGLSHHPCPYASASASGALGPASSPLPIGAFFAPALLSGRPFLAIGPSRDQERPPAIGPPLPA